MPMIEEAVSMFQKDVTDFAANDERASATRINKTVFHGMLVKGEIFSIIRAGRTFEGSVVERSSTQCDVMGGSTDGHISATIEENS